jgi:hypothetical protein
MTITNRPSFVVPKKAAIDRFAYKSTNTTCVYAILCYFYDECISKSISGQKRLFESLSYEFKEIKVVF